MTYRELLNKLKKLPEDQLDLDISVLLMGQDEVFGALDFVTDWKTIEGAEADSDYYTQGINQVSGVLDEGHPYLTVDA